MFSSRGVLQSRLNVANHILSLYNYSSYDKLRGHLQIIQDVAGRTPRFGRGIASGGEGVQWWGACRWTAMYMPFSVYTMAWSGEHWALIVEEFIKNGGSPVATQCAFRIRRFDPLGFFSLGLPQSKGLWTMSPNFGSSEGCDTTGSCCHYTWNYSQGHGQLPREATSVYQYSRPPLE